MNANGNSPERKRRTYILEIPPMLWDKALAGDVRASEQVARLSERNMKLLGIGS